MLGQYRIFVIDAFYEMHVDAWRCMEMHVDASMELHGDARRRKVDWKIVAFLSSVVYYFGDLLKSANITFTAQNVH